MGEENRVECGHMSIQERDAAEGIEFAFRYDDYFLTFIEASVPTHRVGHTSCPFVVSERISQHGGGIMDTIHVLMVRYSGTLQLKKFLPVV